MSNTTATTGITITVQAQIQQALDAFKQLVDGGTKLLGGFEQKQAALSAATTAANLQRQKDYLAQVNKLVLAATGQRLKLLQVEEQEALSQASRVLTETKDFEEAKLKITQTYHARRMALIAEEGAIDAGGGVGGAGGGGAAAQARRMALAQLSHVGRASFSSLAAGINPLMVLQFEAPRIIEASIGLTGGFQNLLAILGPCAAGVAALGVIALSAKEALAAYKAKQEAANSELSLRGQAFDMAVRLQKLLRDNRGIIGVDKANQLRSTLAQAEARAVQTGNVEDLRDVEAMIRLQIQGKVATDEQRQAAGALLEMNRQLFNETLTGYAKERDAADLAYQKVKDEIAERERASGKAIDANAVQVLYNNARIAHEQKLAEIDQKQWDDYLKREQERARLVSEAARKRVQELEEEAAAREKLRRLQMEQVAADWRLTDAQKFGQVSQLSQPWERNRVGPDPGSFAQNIHAGMVQLQNQIGTFSQASASLITNGVGAAFRGVGDSIMGMIDGTRTWGETFAGVAHGIIANLIDLVVQWIEQMTIIAVLKKLFGQKDNEQAAQSAAAWAPAAIAASIASYGTASAIGLGAFLAAAASGTAIAAGMSGVSAREFGGPVEAGRAYIVGEKRPELFVPNTSGFIHPSVPAAMVGSNSKGTDPFASGNGLHVVNVFSERELTRYLQSHAAEQVIVNHITKNRSDLGFRT